MFKTIYFWMTFQILVGIWMFISPFVFGFRDLMGASTNNMIFGAVIVLLGFVVSFYEAYSSEASEFHKLEHQKSS